jgi:hypothetical protein
MLRPAFLTLLSIAQTLAIGATPNPAIASTELAQIWQSRDCIEAHRLVLTVSADVVAEEAEKFGGCLKIEYLQDNSEQASSPRQDADDRARRRIA